MWCKDYLRRGRLDGLSIGYFIARFPQRQRGSQRNRRWTEALLLRRAVYHLGCIPQLCCIPPSAKKPLLAVQTASAIKHLHHVTMRTWWGNVCFPDLTPGQRHKLIAEPKKWRKQSINLWNCSIVSSVKVWLTASYYELNLLTLKCLQFLDFFAI